MGIGVATWRLAQRGEIGFISGMAIGWVVARELQDNGPHDRRVVLHTYPDDEIVDHLLDRFYQPAVRVAKAGHNDLVGRNLSAKLKRYPVNLRVGAGRH